MKIGCVDCGFSYPSQGLPYICPNCGGVLDFLEPFEFNPKKIDKVGVGVWRYRDMFGLASLAAPVTLGEGGTPLIPIKIEDQSIWAKCEFLNPTGSYKDRASTVLMTLIASRKFTKTIEDSSGNAGASFAAYAARAGVKARVFIPENSSGPKRQQIESYGAELVLVPGPRSEAAAAVIKEAAGGTPYASHAYLPFGMAGITTIAYEIWGQLGNKMPGSVIVPAGHGSLLLGILRGFKAIHHNINKNPMPAIIGVQAEGCAPIANAWLHGRNGKPNPMDGETIAEGVRVKQPVRARALLLEMNRDHDQMVAIKEEKILPAMNSLSRLGIHVEPTSALVWAACSQLARRLPKPIVLILTGTGLKYKS